MNSKSIDCDQPVSFFQHFDFTGEETGGPSPPHSLHLLRRIVLDLAGINKRNPFLNRFICCDSHTFRAKLILAYFLAMSLELGDQLGWYVSESAALSSQNLDE